MDEGGCKQETGYHGLGGLDLMWGKKPRRWARTLRRHQVMGLRKTSTSSPSPFFRAHTFIIKPCMKSIAHDVQQLQQQEQQYKVLA